MEPSDGSVVGHVAISEHNLLSQNKGKTGGRQASAFGRGGGLSVSELQALNSGKRLAMKDLSPMMVSMVHKEME
jgi:hypothetical protein